MITWLPQDVTCSESDRDGALCAGETAAVRLSAWREEPARPARLGRLLCSNADPAQPELLITVRVYARAPRSAERPPFFKAEALSDRASSQCCSKAVAPRFC